MILLKKLDQKRLRSKFKLKKLNNKKWLICNLLLINLDAMLKELVWFNQELKLSTKWNSLMILLKTLHVFSYSLILKN